MLKRFLLVFGGTLLFITGIGAFKYQHNLEESQRRSSFVPPPVTVSAIRARQSIWHPQVASVGSLSAQEGIEIASESSGIVDGIHFRNGQKVTQGDLLLTLNDDLEQAELASFKAQARLAKAKFERSQDLRQNNNISETAFDQARADLEVANANVARTQATIDRKTLRSPFTGILGIREFSMGQFLERGTPLVTLQDIRSLRVNFSIPGKHLPQLHAGQEVLFSVSAFPHKEFRAQVIAVNAKVDEKTRTVAVQAQVENENGALRPGMYANIRLMMDQSFAPVLIPSTAITYSPFGDAVFTLVNNEQNELIAQRIYVKTGEQRGDLVAITQGVAAGDLVVNAGSTKLDHGARVQLADTIKL